MDYIRSVEEFMNVLSDEPNLLTYFGTENCSVCHATKPKVENLMRKFPQISAYYCPADHLPGLAGQYIVFTVPAVLVFQRGREIFRSVRFIDLHKVEEVLIELSENNENAFK